MYTIHQHNFALQVYIKHPPQGLYLYGGNKAVSKVEEVETVKVIKENGLTNLISTLVFIFKCQGTNLWVCIRTTRKWSMSSYKSNPRIHPFATCNNRYSWMIRELHIRIVMNTTQYSKMIKWPAGWKNVLCNKPIYSVLGKPISIDVLLCANMRDVDTQMERCHWGV